MVYLTALHKLIQGMGGLKNLGINYGILFTAWGVGGFVMSRISQMLMATTGSFTSSFTISAILLIVGIMFTLTLDQQPQAVQIPQGVMHQPQLGFTMADGGEKIKKDSKEKS